LFAFVRFAPQIEDDPHLLPNVSLVLKWNDTHGETVHATKTITQMICDKVAVFIGPEGNTCHTEAIVAQAWNIPMISYVSVTLHTPYTNDRPRHSTECVLRVTRRARIACVYIPL